MINPKHIQHLVTIDNNNCNNNNNIVISNNQVFVWWHIISYRWLSFPENKNIIIIMSCIIFFEWFCDFCLLRPLSLFHSLKRDSWGKYDFLEFIVFGQFQANSPYFNLIPGRLFGGANQYTYVWLNFQDVQTIYPPFSMASNF